MAAPSYNFAQTYGSDEPEVIYLDNSSYAPDYGKPAPIATSDSQYPYHQSMMAPHSPTSSESSSLTSSSSYTLPPAPDIDSMKKRRQKGKIVAGVVGGTVGLVTLGPLGMVGFGVASALAVKHGGRARERKLQRSYDARVTQDMARTALIHEGVHA